MAESTKGASSTVKSKDKRSSSFDLDMGDDFLKSLKSMAVGDDDAMDFDFGPVSKNKKKTFNFDKEDMDFNLDSDFGKISSFNIDMSDLDISSPCKKDRKSKEMSKEESTAAGNKKKGDGFNFSFDFELDSFGFGSSQESREKAKNHKEKESFNFRSSQESREKAKNNKEKDSFSFGSSQDSGERAMNDQEKECSSKKNGHEGLNEDTGSLGDGVAQKHTASEAGMTFTVDSHINIDKHHDTRKHSLPSNHAMGDNEIPKFQSVSSVVAVEKDKSLLQETVSPRAQETDCQVEEGTLISQSESRRDSSGLQEHVDSMPADVSFLAVGTDINKKVLLDSNTNYEKSVLESSSLEDVATTMKKAGEKSTFESDKHLENNKDRTEAQSNSMYVTNATEDKMQDMKVSDEEQSQNSELSATSLSNGIEAEKLTSGKRGDAGIIRSKFFMPSVKPAAQMQKTTSLTETKVPAFGNKRIDPIPQSCPVEIISQDNKDDKTGSKAGFPPDSRSLPTIKPRQTENQESYQVSGIKKMGSQLDAVESIRSSIGSLRPNEQNVKQGKSAPEKSQASSTDLFTFSSRVCPPSKSHQTTTSTPVSIAAPRNLTITAPTPTAKNTIKEGERSLPVKAAMRTLDTSSLKISAKLGANVETSRTVLQNNMKSSKTGDRHGLKAISQAKDTNFTERLKQMPANLSMKRKVPETNSDLMILLPSKRLSPNGTRGSYEGTERICHKQFNDHEHTGHGNKTSAYEHSQISSQDIPVKMNIQELGSPSAVEDDDSIKKAQACSKGLDDICNMLRKKHEEAKEILVRAIVNNNKLLLLNHPIYEEKIHSVQKFAAGLMMK